MLQIRYWLCEFAHTPYEVGKTVVYVKARVGGLQAERFIIL